MKKLVILAFFLIASASVFAQGRAVVKLDIDVVVGKRPPNPQEMQLMRIEENNNPAITQALIKIDEAMELLKRRPNENYGGNRGRAEQDLAQARISLRKALYFRIWQDTRN